MSDLAIHLDNLGKMYKLYSRPMDKIIDALGARRWLPWRRAEFQPFWALRGVNVDIRKGERVGIVGRNGSGKSTMLKLIASTIAPTEGRVEVQGRVQALLELGTGFHPEFTGRQNIRASLTYLGFSSDAIQTHEEEIIDFAEVDEFIDQPIKTYSAGMYARLAFATATAIEPEILIIDEILGAGDAYFAGKCIERMYKLTEASGATVLFVSHDLGSVQRLCNRVIWIDRGRIRMSGEPLETLKAYGALIRREEDIRLKARDQKVLKKQVALLERHTDIYDPYLFHFVSASGPHPQAPHRIFRLRLWAGEEEVGVIDVGSPMDNAPEHLHYVIDTLHYMDWGPPQRKHGTAYREYGNYNGRYAHAPFEFAVPKTYHMSSHGAGLRLEIEAEAQTDEVAVEVYHEDGYIRLGCLPKGPRAVQIFALPDADTGVNDAPEGDAVAIVAAGEEAKDSQVEPVASARVTDAESSLDYGGGGAKITAVRLLNHLEQESRVFEVGTSMQVVLEVEAYRELINPVFVFCIYLADGQCLSQWLVTSEQLGQRSIQGKCRVTFDVSNLVIGRASCVGSAAIFKYLRLDGYEAESYHVLDRCIHFQIAQRIEDAIERGLCMQPFEATITSIS